MILCRICSVFYLSSCLFKFWKKKLLGADQVTQALDQRRRAHDVVGLLR